MKIGRLEDRRAAFLAIPPFPNRRIEDFERSAIIAPISDAEADTLIERLREARVGGTYWGPRPVLGSRYELVGGSCCELPAHPCVCIGDACRSPSNGEHQHVQRDCDPWHLLGNAISLRCRPDDPLRLIAGLLEIPVRDCDGGEGSTLLSRQQVRALLRSALGDHPYLDPFAGMPLTWSEVIDLCSEWRDLIEANRGLAGAYGFAAWKRTTTDPLLWSGAGDARLARPIRELRAGDKVAIWRSRTSADQLADLAEAGAALIEVEDGFIRSSGLGANCVPPQSIVVDEIGVHFDARSPSALERLVQEGCFDPELLKRARAIRLRIVELGLSKYDSGHVRLERRNDRDHVLVPGQVEDDRAVLASCDPPLSNLELLRRVRTARPHAHIIYKPHPDIEAGHRKGALTDPVALELADEVVREPSISSWIDLVDEVHVNSSLAGFEALLRHKRVSTYGVPFYAGWGLTEDFGSVPERRSARRSLDELVAAALIVYPRYVDPLTNLPCPPEVIVDRLSSPVAPGSGVGGLLIWARTLQGWLNKIFTSTAKRKR